MWLLDAYYFNQSSFQTIRDLQTHLLIKYSPHEDDVDTKLFRDVLEDAKALFAANTKAIDPVPQEKGFDSERCCSWSMKKTSAEFAGYPVNIFLLVEDYPEKKKNAHTESWIITTDLTLDFEEATQKQQAASARFAPRRKQLLSLRFLAPPGGLEPPTHGLGSCSRAPEEAPGGPRGHPAWQSLAKRVLAGPRRSYKRSHGPREPDASRFSAASSGSSTRFPRLRSIPIHLTLGLTSGTSGRTAGGDWAHV